MGFSYPEDEFDDQSDIINYDIRLEKALQKLELEERHNTKQEQVKK